MYTSRGVDIASGTCSIRIQAGGSDDIYGQYCFRHGLCLVNHVMG